MTYNGRVQIFACMEDLENLLNECYTIKNIYDKFFIENKVSVSYHHFCALLKKYNLKKVDTSLIFSKKYKDGIENKLKSLSKEEYERVKNINISKLLTVRDKIIQEKIDNISILNTKKCIKNKKLVYDETNIDEDFGIIRTPRDKLF